jgi:uncharacterized membrane protein
MYLWVLLGHIVGAALLFGGSVYIEALTAAAGKSGSDEEYVSTMMKVTRAADRVMGPATVLTIIFGVWLLFVDQSPYDIGDMFVGVGITVVVIALGISFFWMGPKAKVAFAAVEKSGPSDPVAVANMKSVAKINHIMTLLVAIALVFMVLKPGSVLGI